MTRYERTVRIEAPIERVFHFHDDTANLLRITPPNIKVQIEAMGTPGPGYEVLLKVRQFGLFTMRWLVRITAYEPPHLMIDEQISGPFATWKQIREFRTVDGGTELTDIVEYTPPLGLLGRLADAIVINRQIRTMFAFRQAKTKEILEGLSA